MKKIKAILCILLSLAMVFSLFACAKNNATDESPNASPDSGQSANPGTSQSTSPGASQSENPDSGKEIPRSITIGVTSYLGRFLPGLSPAENYAACDGVFDTVFYTDPVTKEIFSYILEDWSYEDELTLVMTLKPGIIFSNGDEATAEDLLFSFLSHFERGSIKASKMGPLIPEDCSVRDKYTAVFKFSAPFGGFALSVSSIYLINKAWSQQIGWESEDWYYPVGSGPYYCDEYVADNYIKLKLRDDYWNKDNADFAVDEWTIEFYPDASTMYMELELGNISLCEVSSTDYSRYLKDGGENIECMLINMGVQMWFGMGQQDNPIWKEKAVREALAYGVNWEEVGKLGYGDRYIEQNSVVPNDSPFYVDPGTYEYSPEKAKQILADAGYKDGDVSFHIYMMESPLYKSMLEALQFYCSEIGVNAIIEFGDVPSALSKWAVVGGSDGGFMNNVNGSIARDPFATLGTMMGHNIQWCYIDDDVFQQMASDAVYCSDQAEQARRYAELQKYVHDEVLTIPFASSVTSIGYRTDVFSREQIEKHVFTNNYYFITNLSRVSSWTD